MPTVLVFVGAIIVASGTFWAGYRQSKSSATIKAQSAKIIELQEESIKAIKGADICYLLPHAPLGYAGGKISFMILNPNNLPVFDVCIDILRNINTTIDMSPLHYEIGNLISYGVKNTVIELEPGYYQVNIRVRNKKYTQMIHFEPFQGNLGYSSSVSDFQGNYFLKTTSPEGFPSIYPIK